MPLHGLNRGLHVRLLFIIITQAAIACCAAQSYSYQLASISGGLLTGTKNLAYSSGSLGYGGIDGANSSGSCSATGTVTFTYTWSGPQGTAPESVIDETTQADLKKYGGQGKLTPAMQRFNALGRELLDLQTKARRMHVSEVPGDRPRVEQILEERISLMPNDPTVPLSLALLFFREGRLQEALDEWKVADKVNSKALATGFPRPATLILFAELALKLGDDQTARKLYERAGGWVLNSGEVGAYDLPSTHLQALKEAAHYASALEEVPHGLLDEALADFKVAMPLMQHSLSARLAYGRLLHRMSHYAEAKAEFRAAERMAPDVATRKDIHKERLRLGLILTESRTVITDGVAKITTVEIPDKGK